MLSRTRLPQGAYSAFVYSYAVEKPLSVGHKVAGYLPSLFWGFITLGRLISIPVSSRVKPATMVFINVVSGALLLLETEKNRSPCAIALPQDTFSDWTLPQVGGWGMSGYKEERVGKRCWSGQGGNPRYAAYLHGLGKALSSLWGLDFVPMEERGYGK